MSDGEFTCEASALAKALRDIVSIVPTGTDVIPILKNVLIEAKGKTVVVTVTDLDKSASRTFPANVKKAGATTVEAGRFASVIGAIPNGQDATVTMTDANVALVSGRSKYRFGALPASDFPPMPFDKPSVTFEAGGDFLAALAMSRYAHSTETTRYYLCGAFMHMVGDMLTIAATDGQQLAQVAIASGSAGMADIILPSAAVDLVIKLAGDKAMGIEIAAARARFDFGDTILTAKLIDGTYPDYQRVVPSNPKFDAVIKGPEMIGALTRIALVTDDKDRKIAIDLSADKMTISNAGRDEGVEELLCAYSGEPMRIGFNSKYLRDTLNAMGAADIVIGLTDPRSPALFSSPAKDGARMVVMPMRIA